MPGLVLSIIMAATAAVTDSWTIRDAIEARVVDDVLSILIAVSSRAGRRGITGKKDD